MGILTIWVRWKVPETPDISLRSWHRDSLTHRHSPWDLAKGQWLWRHKRLMGKDWVVWHRDKGWKENRHCCIVGPHSDAVNRQAPSAYVEPSSCATSSEAEFAWWDLPSLPFVFLGLYCTQPTNCLQLLIAGQPALHLRWATYVLAGSSLILTWPACSPPMLGESWWWASGNSLSCNISWVDHRGLRA